MAARINRGVGEGSMSDNWRERIRAGQLANRLMDHFEGKIELTNSQIKAADLLFKRLEPELNRVEVAGDKDAPIVHTVKWGE